jgi:hypothetical protein
LRRGLVKIKNFKEVFLYEIKGYGPDFSFDGDRPGAPSGHTAYSRGDEAQFSIGDVVCFPLYKSYSQKCLIGGDVGRYIRSAYHKLPRWTDSQYSG